MVLFTSELSGTATSVPLVTAAQPEPTGLTTQENVAEAVLAAASVAVAVTEYVAAVVGVPEIRPEELIDRPAGRPVAVQVYGAVPLDAESWRLTAVPTVLAC